MSIRIVIWIFLVFVIQSAPVYACKCVGPPPGLTTSRDRAKWAANGEDAIFEGKVRSADLKWRVIDANVGQLVAADLDEDPPLMAISFEVMRDYRGVSEKNVEVSTGLGGGDCGFHFDIGLTYLVYAHKEDSNDLFTSICSATALLEDSEINVAYLRGEPEIPAGSIKGKAPDKQSKLCGTVLSEKRNDPQESQLYLIDVENGSNLPSDEAEIKTDGSFCFTDVSPGKYRILFVERAADESIISFAYFPGSFSAADAVTIEIKPGETSSHLTFRVSAQRTYSVTGTLSVAGSPAIPEGMYRLTRLSFFQTCCRENIGRWSYLKRITPRNGSQERWKSLSKAT